jgi:hypothetical protein
MYASKTQRHLRHDAEDAGQLQAAQQACAHVGGGHKNECSCVFDVMATGDYGMAAFYIRALVVVGSLPVRVQANALPLVL